VTTERAALAGASELLRALGLLVDGPARWGDPAIGRAPGVFIVELPGGAPQASIDIVSVRRWIERVPGLSLDGARPTPQELGRKLSEFWLPGEPVLFVGRSAKAVGSRVAAIYATALGDARPYAAANWLKTLDNQRDLRVWWADTDAHEEYEDALLEQTAERNEGKLPFANLSGSPEKLSAVENGLLTDSPQQPATTAAGRSAGRRTATAAVRKAPVRRVKDAVAKPQAAPTYLSAEGLERLTTELDHLRTTVRPEVIARVKSARELGDLRENGDYEYARKEQSFVEGRIQALEALVRTGVVMEESSDVSGAAQLGSTVVVESDGEQQTFVLVGSAEANAAAGRISNVSPVGRALMGARAGDEVVVALPAGSVAYSVIEVR
jgi:transcription elongation factor GreA